MSSEREYETAARGASGPGQEPDVQPAVYIPQPAQAPAYERYSDPAAAHGWENAYDETRELPPVVDSGEAGPPPAADPGVGRAERRRRQRRRGGRRLAVVVGAGALGVAGTVALIAGMAGAGSPAESRSTKDGGATASTRTDASPAVTDLATSAGSSAPSTPGPAASPSATATRNPAATTSAPAATTSAPAATTSSGPAPTPAASTPAAPSPTGTPGRGHGHGWSRHPH